jgi:hypothetical protein
VDEVLDAEEADDDDDDDLCCFRWALWRADCRTGI